MSGATLSIRSACRIAALLALAAGCVSTGPDAADRLFLAGDLPAAARAYREYLDLDPEDPEGTARAGYRLAIIHALPGELHDWDRSVRALQAVLEEHPGTRWADQAALLLSLHDERRRLAEELAGQRQRASLLLGEVAKLQDEAERAGDEATDRQARIDALAADIEQLRSRIGQLTRSLEEREAELERLKRIDLETPP